MSPECFPQTENALHHRPSLHYGCQMSSSEYHVPLSYLWLLARENAILPQDVMRHINDCNDCLNGLRVYKLWDTFEDGEQAFLRSLQEKRTA